MFNPCFKSNKLLLTFSLRGINSKNMVFNIQKKYTLFVYNLLLLNIGFLTSKWYIKVVF